MHPSTRLRLSIAVAGLLAVALSPLRGQDISLDVGVRSNIDAPPKKAAAAAALKKFSFMPPVEAPSPEKLLRPVSPDTLNAVLALVQQKLIERGFVGTQPKERPEIAITVEYGRGFPVNPWRREQRAADDAQPLAGMNSGGTSGPFNASAPRTMVTGLPTQFEPGREAKLQAAYQEKLYFSIVAWDFASMQKGRTPQKLWTTMAVVDDPDHRDLNQVYKQMLEAAGQYFGRNAGQPEVEIATTLRAGRVEIGTPRVVADPKSAAK